MFSQTCKPLPSRIQGIWYFARCDEPTLGLTSRPPVHPPTQSLTMYPSNTPNRPTRAAIPQPNPIKSKTTQRNPIKSNTTQRNATQHNATQRNATLPQHNSPTHSPTYPPAITCQCWFCRARRYWTGKTTCSNSRGKRSLWGTCTGSSSTFSICSIPTGRWDWSEKMVEMCLILAQLRKHRWTQWLEYV